MAEGIQLTCAESTYGYILRVGNCEKVKHATVADIQHIQFHWPTSEDLVTLKQALAMDDETFQNMFDDVVHDCNSHDPLFPGTMAVIMAVHQERRLRALERLIRVSPH